MEIREFSTEFSGTADGPFIEPQTADASEPVIEVDFPTGDPDVVAVETLKDDFQAYSPTKLEYFAGMALQGLLVGRAERDIKKSVSSAIKLAQEMVDKLDE